ncbi:MAG TPA: TetR/AcrR family transcriptional regulator [Candidatus Limnocylindrales bacterium]|nr:TetR/AcrR family transcriptional regulator [Candidatus Limnocylindrales bacterium]
MATPSPAPLKAPHLQPGDWIQAALNRLIASDVESVRVELLARDLRVSKGSFYWHFRDREDLLSQVLDTWAKSERDRLDVISSEPNAPARWARFVEDYSDGARVRLELAVRSWAHRDPKVAETVANADRDKRRFITDVLHEVGFARPAAESWSQLALLVCLGWLDYAAQATSGQPRPGDSSLGDLLSKLVIAASSGSSAAQS